MRLLSHRILSKAPSSGAKFWMCEYSFLPAGSNYNPNNCILLWNSAAYVQRKTLQNYSGTGSLWGCNCECRPHFSWISLHLLKGSDRPVSHKGRLMAVTRMSFPNVTQQQSNCGSLEAESESDPHWHHQGNMSWGVVYARTPWTYRFCFSWLADVDCVMPLLSQTDLGMVKSAKACSAKCFKKNFIQGWKETLWKERLSDHNLEQCAAFSTTNTKSF